MWVLVYLLPAAVALLNLVLMRRPGDTAVERPITALIPARNEEQNLQRLAPLLLAQGFQVIVFDDESDDATADVARRAGALVVRAREPLPEGWTGKNRACHELAKAAAEASPSDWWVFLDADVEPGLEFHSALADLVRTVGRRASVVTGFPAVRPGRGMEPLFFGWVVWILLSSNPYGLVSRSGIGHNRFLNGQFSLWRATTYTSIWPNELLKGSLMEDVMTGRLLARLGVRVEVVNLGRVLGVRMYETWREALDGMSKNSYEVTGSVVGTIALALLFLVAGWAWAFSSHWALGLAVLTLSGVLAATTVRSALWPALLMPLVCTIGGYTMIRSLWWRLHGKTTWKGRRYELR